MIFSWSAASFRRFPPSQETRASDHTFFFSISHQHSFFMQCPQQIGSDWYVLRPDTLELVQIDPAQRWFWSPEWQRKEAEADEDLRRGDYEDFDDFDDFIDSL